MRYLTEWFKRYFSDPEVAFLTIFLLIFFAVVLTMGDMLAPVLASLVIAYLLEGLVGMIERKRLPRLVAVLVVYIGFLLFVTGAGAVALIGYLVAGIAFVARRKPTAG